MRRLRAVISRFRRETPAEFVYGYGYRGAGRIFRLAVFHAMCLEPSDAGPGATGPSAIECGFVEEERLRREARDPASGLTDRQITDALAQGDRCFGAFLDGILASHTWFSGGRAHLRAEVFVEFSPQFAYSRWSFTREEYRGRHLHSMSKQRALAILALSGCRGILSLVETDNGPSLRSARRAGCTRVGSLWMARTPGRLVLDQSPRCADYGLKLVTGPDPAPLTPNAQHHAV